MATKVPAWAKGYITLKNGLFAFIVICAVIIILTGVGIQEWKKKNKEFQSLEKYYKERDEFFIKKILADSLTLDSTIKANAAKSQIREKEVVKIYHEKEIRVKEITNPDLTNKRIRDLFAK